MENRKTETKKTKANSERKLHFVAAFVFEKLAKQWAEEEQLEQTGSGRRRSTVAAQ